MAKKPSYEELEKRVRELEQAESARQKVVDELRTAKESSERERNLLQGVIDGARNIHLVYLDLNFNFVRVNDAYAETCGYQPEEMIGKNHFALYPHPENEAIFARVRDTGIPFEIKDKPFTFPDQPERGTTYWDWSLLPVKEPDGTVAGLVFSLVETTDRKQVEEALRESEEKYRSLFEGSKDAIVLTTQQGRFIEANPSALELFGYTKEEMLKINFQKLYVDPIGGYKFQEEIWWPSHHGHQEPSGP